MDKIPSSGSAVVARFMDGRLLKGTTHDFAPQKPLFHLSPCDNPGTRAIPVTLRELKAVFFVRTFEGNPKHAEVRDLNDVNGQGRKIVVTFGDGEVLLGFTTGYSKDKPGFFVIPADPKSNNSRIFVVTSSIKDVAWADTPISVRTGV